MRLRRPDLVVRLTDGRLFHLELQSDNDATMPWRMVDYYSLLRQHYGQAPHQQVLYVGEAPMTFLSPSMLRHGLGHLSESGVHLTV